MSAGVVFRYGKALFTSVLIISALLLVIEDRHSLAASEQDAREQGSTTMIHGVVVDEWNQPRQGILVRCADFEAQEVSLGETLSSEQGQFTLAIAPISEKVRCWIDDDDVSKKEEKILPTGRDSQVVFTVKPLVIPELVGWIQIPKDWEIGKALVQLTQSHGVVRAERPDEDGKVTFKDVKAGPARLVYSFDGLGTMVLDRMLVRGSDVSASLRFDWFPSALILLVPGITVLGVLAGMSWRWRDDPDKQRRAGDPALMLASLLLWGATFFLLWFMLKNRGGAGLHFFHPRLSFALSVPIFGFLGALIFVIDLLRTGSQAVPAYREFALRLVLGPYVAIVMVLLFGGTFEIINLDKLGSQATVAFFSGFLVVLVLQSLAEKGNEVLGQWRSTSRYEPSEIARQFNLHMEDDVKLQKAHLKYLEQLRLLSKDELRMMARQAELGEGFLVGLQERLREEDLLTRLGKETWTKLNQEGIRTVGDVALLSPERLQQVATNQQIDREALTAFSEACKKTFVQDFYQPRSRPFMPSAVGDLEDRQN
jgi:hypothetical protein